MIAHGTPSSPQRHDPLPPRFNIARYCLGDHAASSPDRTALIITDPAGMARQWSYAEMDEAVRRLAGGLSRLGLSPGSRIMLRLENGPAYVLTFFASMAAGLVPLPSSAALTPEEAGFLLADCGAEALALSAQLAPPDSLPANIHILSEESLLALAGAAEAIDYADTACDDPAFLIYTSGTVGKPKGVLHGHRTAWGRRPMYRGWSCIGPEDVALHAGAFNWTYTLGVGLMDPWANGATAVLCSGGAEPADWPRLIEQFGVTIFATVPSLYRRILKYATLAPGQLATLRHGLTAGEALPPALLDAWRDATGTSLYEALGMSEISTYISTAPGMAIRPGSPGKPQPGRRVAILDPEPGSAVPLPAGQTGLLAVHRSDPGLMLGYWNCPEEEVTVWRGDWFCGGDLAHIDDDGYVWFHGRQDDILNPMGYRLSPLEIENTLARSPAVHEVAVGERAVSDDVSILVAFVVPEGTPDEVAVLHWAEEHLAAYKRPKQVIFIDHLPRNATGKLLRRELPGTSSSGS